MTLIRMIVRWLIWFTAWAAIAGGAYLIWDRRGLAVAGIVGGIITIIAVSYESDNSPDKPATESK